MSLTLEQLKDAYEQLITGQNVVSFRSPNGKTVTYGPGDIEGLRARIASEQRKLRAALPRTRLVVTSKGL